MMIRITICVAALLAIGVAYADWNDLPFTDEANIEDRRMLWNGYWGDRTKGEGAFNGEVHGWMDPSSAPALLERDANPPGDPTLTRKFYPPWWEVKPRFR